MSAAGRKPKPAAQRRREGNAGKRKIKEAWETRGAPKPPEWLQDDARAFWNDLIVELDALGVLDRVDGPVLIAWCLQWQTLRDARRVVDEEGIVAFGSTGQITEHPMLATERAASAMLLRFAAEFGATAAARARLDVARDPSKTPAAGFDAIGESPRLRMVKGGKGG